MTHSTESALVTGHLLARMINNLTQLIEQKLTGERVLFGALCCSTLNGTMEKNKRTDSGESEFLFGRKLQTLIYHRQLGTD